MDEKELKEIFEFLQKAGANPQLCDTEVPYFETSVRAGLPTENFAEEAFVEMMSLPRKMLASTPAMILDIDGDSMEDANLYDGDRVLVLMKQRFRDGDIVVARIGDGYTVKCYYEDDEGKHWLVAQNKEKEEEYRPILLEEQENVQVYGVVAFVMRSELRVPTRNIRRQVNKEREERRKNEAVPEWKVRKAIRDIAEEIEVARLWFAVYKTMVDLSVVDDGDVDGFCKMVYEEVPNHGHLPVVKDLQRLEVDRRSRGQVIDLFTKKSITCPSDLLPLPETVGCIDMGDQKVIADETVREVLLSKCGARTIPEFQLHTKDRQKDIVRDVMRELGAGPRQMVRVCGLTYAVVYPKIRN